MECIILRGLPGSGKSTKARELAGTTGRIHSTNTYFSENGVYRYDKKLLMINHERNYQAFRSDIRKNTELVIVDNCNHLLAHFGSYLILAKEAGYQVSVVQLPHLRPEEAAMRSPHNVPQKIIERMLHQWEPYIL